MSGFRGYDCVVAGAGVWGCALARRLAESGRKVLLLDSRKQLGGNSSAYTIGGVEVHAHGSHIFHTSNERVFEFATRFCEFNGYRHRVVSVHKGREYHLPFGRTLVREFFGVDEAPSKLPDDMKEEMFRAFTSGYTAKQWGVKANEVDAEVLKRLIWRDDDSVDYFRDAHQGIPREGYDCWFRCMVSHPNIKVALGVKYELGDELEGQSVYYSGRIDALFGCRFGRLPYRSLRFVKTISNSLLTQRTAVVNFADLTTALTRRHEYRHYHLGDGGKFAEATGGSVIVDEYPCAYDGDNEPYYPVKSKESEALADRYRELVSEKNRTSNGRLVVGGRLGGFKYLNMDSAIAEALSVTV